MALTYESLPPQIQQVLMQRFGVKSPADAQMLMQRLANDPEELASVLQSIGIDADAKDAAQLAQQAQQWIDDAATKTVEDGEQAPPRTPAEGEEGEEAPPQPEEEQAPEQGDEAPAQDYDDADAAQSDDDEVEEGEGSPPQDVASGTQGGGNMPAARASGAPSPSVQDLLAAATGGRGVPSVRGGAAGRMNAPSDMDMAITEMLSKGRQEGGSNPQSRNFQVPRPKMPHSPAAQASNDPRMRKMIADIYRTVANQSSGPERAYQPSGDRT